MSFFDRNRKILTALVTFFCIATALFTVDRANPTLLENAFSFVIVPVQKFNTNAVSWLEDKSDYFKNIQYLQDENHELKEKILLQDAQLSRLKYLENENDKLTSLLQMNNKLKSFNTVGARIIAKDIGNWYDIFTIDKGTNDGIKPNMVVICGEGLVGRIKECGYNYSKVVSIIDDTDAVSSKCLRTDDLGYISGDLANKGLCVMNYIDLSAEIIVGDEIITSHLSEVFPQGITIGYVKEIHTDSNALNKYAEITPAVDFKHLENVLIITDDFQKQYIEEPAVTTTQAE